MTKEASDGSTASYYDLPAGAQRLGDLIAYRNMNHSDGEMFCALYRKGLASHSDALRDARKVLFYAHAEVKRLEALRKPDMPTKPGYGKVEWWEQVLGFVVDAVELKPPFEVAAVTFRPGGAQYIGRELEQRLREFGLELILVALGGGVTEIKVRLPSAVTHK